MWRSRSLALSGKSCGRAFCGAPETHKTEDTQDTMWVLCGDKLRVAVACRALGGRAGWRRRGIICRTVCGGCGAGRVSWAETGAWGGVDKYSSGQRTRTKMVMRPHVDVPTRYALSTRHTPLLQVCSPHISTLVTTHLCLPSRRANGAALFISCSGGAQGTPPPFPTGPPLTRGQAQWLIGPWTCAGAWPPWLASQAAREASPPGHRPLPRPPPAARPRSPHTRA
jgi:hypothetical protein